MSDSEGPGSEIGDEEDEEILHLAQVSDLQKSYRLKPESVAGYNSKQKYILKFMQAKFPAMVVQVINVDGQPELKIPLSAASIKFVFAKLQVDTDLPRGAKKKRRELEERRNELTLIRQAAINRGDDDVPGEPPPLVVNLVTASHSDTLLYVELVVNLVSTVVFMCVLQICQRTFTHPYHTCG